MNDLFTTKVGDQVKFLESAFIAYSKRLVMQEIAAQIPWLFTIPILGPFANAIVGRLVGKILADLARSAEYQAYFINTRRRADAQASRFMELVEKRAQSQNPEELEANEKDALKAFNDLAKYST